jgi:hypothetical protein
MKPVRVWIGIVLLVLGVLGILDATGTLESSATLDQWWPVAVIGLGVLLMVGHGTVSLGPLIVTAIGFVLLVDRQDWTDQDVIGPTILVVLGAALVFAAFDRRPRRGRDVQADAGEALAVFSATKTRNRSTHLRRANVSAIFGGATLDLREAHIDDEATVDALALFGGVDILVPKDWRVSLSGIPVMGGYEDRTTGNGSLPADAPVLHVNATAIFGGVDVANGPRS